MRTGGANGGQPARMYPRSTLLVLRWPHSATRSQLCAQEYFVQLIVCKCALWRRARAQWSETYWCEQINTILMRRHHRRRHRIVCVCWRASVCVCMCSCALWHNNNMALFRSSICAGGDSRTLYGVHARRRIRLNARFESRTFRKCECVHNIYALIRGCLGLSRPYLIAKSISTHSHRPHRT